LRALSDFGKVLVQARDALQKQDFQALAALSAQAAFLPKEARP
jgi:hypothetical protein